MSHLSQFLTLGFPQYCSCGLPHIITNQTTLLTPEVLDRCRPAIYTYLYLYLYLGSVSPVFLFFFLVGRKFLAKSPFNSSSSSSFSVFTNSGLYQVGGWVINKGPPGGSAIVKWKAATKVLLGVYLMFQ